MEETQVVIEMPQVEYKIDSVPNTESEEIIEYCLDAATNITQPVKNDGDHDAFSDEGNEKVLTTLETIQTDGHEDEESFSTYEIEDLPVNDQPESSAEPVTSKTDQLSESEIARLQLESLGTQKVGRPKKSQVTILDEKGNISSKKLSDADESHTKLESATPVTLLSLDTTNEEVVEEACEVVEIAVEELDASNANDGDCTLENRISNLTESPSTGIEIPKELITGSALSSPMFVQNNSKPLQNEDLLAILEGNDESFEEHKSTDASMTAEKEKEVALKQMMSLPVNPRGRRPNPAKTKKKETKPKTSNLVNALVSDWSDNDSKKGESEGECEKPKQTPKSSKPVAVINQQIDNERSERRSRIIKKKIIWDPDAPETAFSYASLVQSAPKKPKIAQTKAKEKEADVIEETGDARKRKSESISPATVKKKRVGEIDKLLADEGAINILNALKHENNNADLSDADSIPVEKSPSKRIARKVNTEANDVPSASRNSESAKCDTPNQKNARKPKNATVAVKKEPKKRAPNKSNASESWDYIYNSGHRGDDSMIIRRRSNSSYSSTASLRLSIDGAPNENEKSSETSEKTFEFAKPTVKKNSASELSPQRQLILSDMRGKKSISKVDGESAVRRSSRAAVVESVESNSVKAVAEQHKKQETQSKRKVTEKGNDTAYTEINIKMLKNCAHIVLAPNVSGKLRNSFSIQMLNEVTRALKDLSTNSTVRAVLISSSNASFCNGIDFSNLVQNTVDKRKQSATELSTALSEFILSIAKFQKILIAGVHGHTVGIGVTILPLFDIIYATNKASFATPYANIGQVPENGSAFVKSNKLSHRLKTELLYLNETVKAADALQNGLITKIINSDAFESEIVHQTEQIAMQSSQSMEATKSLTHVDVIDKLDDDLAKEQKLLIQHWATAECQDRFKNFLSKEKWQN
ncbi:chromodomain Y-like protein isoform X1 [Bradysia coprophila]|uniref:chromodomain Y-like protein isoform X1 n=1 Tax=Bradysia coprophila TaxID=38358 RepID=UPI00187DAB87|nr:chromodomain Y-like protein isoform X1 [Bradysia coprophila]